MAFGQESRAAFIARRSWWDLPSGDQGFRLSPHPLSPDPRMEKELVSSRPEAHQARHTHIHTHTARLGAWDTSSLEDMFQKCKV